MTNKKQCCKREKSIQRIHYVTREKKKGGGTRERKRERERERDIERGRERQRMTETQGEIQRERMTSSFNSVRLDSLDLQGDITDDSADIFFHSFLQKPL